ncbi:MAG: 5'-methylthioadenosine/adenosylhomocysteine nucleosidase [Lachnospiraceae bacterium]|nr:5'-methylthioadenosine/adenosylhomocysteine nucleosidase [Lachnospiraceae bacterium]
MIGIIGAMDQEVDGLIAVMVDKMVHKKAGMEFHRGTLFGRDAVVVKGGVGKVAAALCTQILIDCFYVTKVINTGAAGSLSSDVKIGDLVIATELVQHDMDSVDFGFPLGQIPFLEPFAFAADQDMIALAEETAKKCFPSMHIYKGRVCTGDEFVGKKERKEWIVNHFGGLCTEMEGAAVGQTAYMNGVPFLVLRAISDEADDSATVDFPTFSKEASQRSIELIKAMFEAMV